MKAHEYGSRYFRLVSATIVILGALWASGVLTAPRLAADPDVGLTDLEIFEIARGGQLYDNWITALEAEAPEGTHPAYPANGKSKGENTWRCKECHGWDYMGEDGAYGKGMHYTGIKGIRRMVGGDPAEIERIIRDDTHRYTPAMLPPKAVHKLALFVTRGQINMNQYIDRSTKEAIGSRRRGAPFFHTICVICHGFDGTELSHRTEAALAAFGSPGSLGYVADENPWEALHKIRNGQPGVGMVALRVLSIQDQVDVLTYLQTLPVSPPR